eukprot:TRINITY_DN77442_c0_g1_i1.p1 TRINITY_DN77442_c0_g1~~TRINITY_DN77442_c0_g1_i1.p1  ORF type:complete len:207 (+),score=0.93 TRINITY_DN77442_c0_g1_i1:93-713(+)
MLRVLFGLIICVYLYLPMTIVGQERPCSGFIEQSEVVQFTAACPQQKRCREGHYPKYKYNCGGRCWTAFKRLQNTDCFRHLMTNDDDDHTSRSKGEQCVNAYKRIGKEFAILLAENQDQCWGQPVMSSVCTSNEVIEEPNCTAEGWGGFLRSCWVVWLWYSFVTARKRKTNQTCINKTTTNMVTVRGMAPTESEARHALRVTILCC